ncbi:hypothetical protein QYE76_053171 [Lolium multiflorum]|uniref:Uncharacterized protein n=1 Tax=Lolium multiflorum TaxID=4521 RepID=A0AAD8SWD8_LOLMU|nr:hypothetical protein QYE76_053171 [Lolium multiflorum]
MRAATSGTAPGAIAALRPGAAPEDLIGRVAAPAEALIQEADHLFEEMSRASKNLCRGRGQVVGVVVQSASDAQATVQGILSDAHREAATIVERACRQAEDILSAAHHEADDFLRGALLPEVISLLVHESAVDLPERVVEEDRLSVQEREHILAKKEAEFASRETVVQIGNTQKLLDDRKAKLEQFEAWVSKRLEEEHRSNA